MGGSSIVIDNDAVDIDNNINYRNVVDFILNNIINCDTDHRWY